MAVATLVLERNTSTQELEDKRHNALIGERYAKLINPELKINDLKNSAVAERESVLPTQEAQVQTSVCDPVAPAAPQAEQPDVKTYYAEPYLAPSGRADADIFRADSEINKRLRANQMSASPAKQGEEEENEDLRPTSTTIQYKTENAKKSAEEGGKISTAAKRHLNLSNRDKIIIAAVVTVIVALFVLIIINSAIISGINEDLNRLQASLDTVRGAYSSISDRINDYVANYLQEDVRKLGESLGMVK